MSVIGGSFAGEQPRAVDILGMVFMLMFALNEVKSEAARAKEEAKAWRTVGV